MMSKLWGPFVILLVTTLVPMVAAAAPPTINYFYVSSTGDCGSASPCYSTIQAAVDATVPGELNHVKVAGGTYSGVSQRSVNHIVYFQVVMITESVLLEGGYSTGNWTRSDPVGNPTVIDATPKGSLDTGRCVTIVGDGAATTVAIDGFTLTGGAYTGLGNGYASNGDLACPGGGANSDCGGGVFAKGATLSLRDSIVTGNTASTTNDFNYGGGVLLWETLTGTTIERCTISSNVAGDGFLNTGDGGGVAVYSALDVAISDCEFLDNRARTGGAGLDIQLNGGLVTVARTNFDGNESSSVGASGIFGSFIISGTVLRLDRVVFSSGIANAQNGHAVSAGSSSSGSIVEMDNVIIGGFSNESASGSVIRCNGVSLQARQITIEGSPALSALEFDTFSGRAVTADITNALVASVAAAFEADATDGTVTVTHDHTLTYNVTDLHVTEAGTPTFNATNGVTGDPLLDASFRLQAGSAAIDTGVDSGVTVDIDGEVRPQGLGFDIGADELAVGNPSSIFEDGFESGNTSLWSAGVQ